MTRLIAGLLLRNLSTQVSADQILSFVGSLSNLAIKSIRIPKDAVYNIPRGVCFLELHTTTEAIQLNAMMVSMDTRFLADSQSTPLFISYAKRNSASLQTAAVASNAASVALAAAQWTNQTDTFATSHTIPTVTVNGAVYPKYPTPDPSKFQHEETSGYYYDPTTTLYYDKKSTYYYNSTNQQYLYWCSIHETYLPVDAAAQTSSASKKSESQDKKPKGGQDKVKTAKKIAKDMEKWAKTLNQKSAKAISSFSELIPSKSPAVPDASKSSYKPSFTPTVQPEKVLEVKDPVQEIRKRSQTIEDELIDGDKLLCLLCKRQFSSRDQLCKHKEKSDLHKSNLKQLLITKLSEEEMELLDKSDETYIDRAEERRKKWGGTGDVSKNVEKEKYLQEMAIKESFSSVRSADTKIDESNKGNKMLKAMGWTEGQGLGKTGQGRSEIIQVSGNKDGAGLGAPIPLDPVTGSDSYKIAVKRAMVQRYKELDS